MALPTGTILDLRVGERALVGMMFAYNVALLVTLYLLKPARDSLFLIEVGAANLPLVFLATAAAVVPVTVLYGRIGRRVKLSRLVNATTIVLILSLVAMRAAVALEATWAYVLLYVWVSIYSVLATSQYWLLAGAVFDPAQAKRIFALLSFGAILGAILGGELTGYLVEEVEMRTRDLLWVAVGVLTVTAVLINLIRWRATDGRAGRPEGLRRNDGPARSGPVLGLLRESRHLQLITAVIALAVLTTALVDFQFKTVSSEAFPIRSDLTSFLGRFYARVSIIALALQFFVAPRIIRVQGVGGALLVLPVALAAGSVAMFVVPGLIAGVVLRGAEQSLKHSIDRTGRELLFLPVPLAVKKQTKVFIDVFVDQGMQGLAGLLLLAALAVGVSIQGLSLVVLALLGVWIGLAVWARRSYVQAFRETLPRESEPPPELVPAPTEDVPTLIGSLSSDNTEEVLDTLETLDAIDAELPVERACALLDHRSARVRRRVIALLAKQGEDGFADVIATYLTDRDAEVRLEAARFLYQTLGSTHHLLLQRGLEHPDVRIRAAAIGVIAESGTEKEQALITDEMVRGLLDHTGAARVETSIEAIKAMGALDRPAFHDVIRDLLDRSQPQVVRAAIQAAGKTGHRIFVGKLLRLLGVRAYEKAAREALVAFGERIFGTLYDYLTDDDVAEPVRRNIPRILSELPTQSAVDLMLLSLERLRAPLLYDVVKALNKIRASNPGLRFNEAAIDVAALGEIRALATVQAALFRHGQAEDDYVQSPGARLVREALRHEREQSLERVARMLGLRYPSTDMHAAYLGLTEDEELRASAAEFLDSVLDWDLKRFLVPLLDEAPDQGDVRVAEEMAEQPFPTWQSALRDLLMVRHPRPLACALDAARQAHPDALPDDLAEIAHAACTPDPSDDPPEMHGEAPAPFRPSASGDGAAVESETGNAGQG
ncbi:MAG: Npt1/Npt2 family nucleotide transporter [Bacteroidota bacterium]